MLHPARRRSSPPIRSSTSQGVITQPKTNELEVVTFVKQRVEYDFIDPKIKADYETLQKGASGDIAGLSRSLDDKKWIVTYSRDDASGTWYLLRPSDEDKRRCCSARARQLEKYKLSKMEPIEFTARDGMKILRLSHHAGGHERRAACRWCCSYTVGHGAATCGATTRGRSGSRIADMLCFR